MTITTQAYAKKKLIEIRNEFSSASGRLILNPAYVDKYTKTSSLITSFFALSTLDPVIRDSLRFTKTDLRNMLHFHDLILRVDRLDDNARELVAVSRKVWKEAVITGGLYSKTSFSDFIAASLHFYNNKNSLMENNFASEYLTNSMLYPRIIHIETFAACNAKCSFCDYKDMQRKGEKMPDEIINKIFNELSIIPSSHSFQIQPYKVSEPFLDERLPEVIKKALECNPSSSVSLISNGNFMPDRIINHIFKLSNRYPCATDPKRPRIFLTISLNEVDKESYEELMKMNVEKTINNLKKLHDLYSRVDPCLSIYVSRVSTDARKDKIFMSFVKREFPLFKHKLAKMNDWAGTNSFASSCNNEDSLPLSSYRNLYCNRWFDLSITATGRLSLCCMDSGVVDYELGNVKVDNCIELYRQKIQRYIGPSYKRKDSPAPCSDCTYFPAKSFAFADVLKHNILKSVEI